MNEVTTDTLTITPETDDEFTSEYAAHNADASGFSAVIKCVDNGWIIVTFNPDGEESENQTNVYTDFNDAVHALAEHFAL